MGLTYTSLGQSCNSDFEIRRANNFLTEANEKVFKPRGLFCLVMSFRPNDVPKGDVAMAQVDTSNTVLKWLDPPKSGINLKSSNLRSSSGVTHGELEMPETAPLIYADTGYAEISKPKDEESARGSLSSSRKITRNYFDKRAQAKYVSFQILRILNNVSTYCVTFEGLQAPRLRVGS